ncbi:hypothetical protein M885DRAFT_530796 [Pelagophyceae sp. CCMP2097]|nr:hypothetical protein M885DRAFT_530796 [Pelagophyceae sp. CCMP2097]
MRVALLVLLARSAAAVLPTKFARLTASGMRLRSSSSARRGVELRATDDSGSGAPSGAGAWVARRPLATVAAVFLAGSIFGGAASTTVADSFSRYRTVDDVPSRAFKDHSTISAVVVKVSDGDTLRVRHAPPLDFLRPAAKTKAEGGSARLADETLQVRLYAVDTPETAKFGNPGQDFGDTATALVSSKMGPGANVRVKLLAKDQYGRAVAAVSYASGPFGLTRADMSEELLRAGLARVYRQGGAEYDGGLAKWDAIEAEAKKSGRGIWADGGGAVDPAAYKRGLKAAKAAAATNR